ncbi:MAG: DUF4265 domain-containing protein [Anaeromyxobacteraceae bacterium]
MTKEEAPGGYVRLLVALDHDAGGDGPEDEWLWAEPLGSSRFRVESTPFFAYGLSHGDVVRADERSDLAHLEEVERKSGHRTLRVALDADWDLDRGEVQRFLDALLTLGCTYEAMPPKIVALDVPPEVEVAEVISRLQTQVHDGVLVWEWADPRPS